MFSNPPNRNQVKAQLMMRTEGRLSLFEDIGTQVSINRVSAAYPIDYNGRWGSMAVTQLLKM